MKCWEYIQLHCNLNYISDIRNPIYLKECLAFLNEIDNDAFTIQHGGIFVNISPDRNAVPLLLMLFEK